VELLLVLGLAMCVGCVTGMCPKTVDFGGEEDRPGVPSGLVSSLYLEPTADVGVSSSSSSPEEDWSEVLSALSSSSDLGCDADVHSRRAGSGEEEGDWSEVLGELA
jgi:hypothetical protein